MVTKWKLMIWFVKSFKCLCVCCGSNLW
jgi:hypothetical protein